MGYQIWKVATPNKKIRGWDVYFFGFEEANSNFLPTLKVSKVT